MKIIVFVLGLILIETREAGSFGLLKAFVSPPPRFTRVRRIDEASTSRSFRGDVRLDFVGLVEKHGYPAEEHFTTTEDGYNLVLHRIPASPLSPRAKRKPIVFVQHGAIASSDTWVLIGPKRDLAFLMADAGYDVWIGNFRGNTYSRSHSWLSPSDPKFWDFSYHEMGYYDLPASIDHVLAVTGQKRIIYIGHSMGTTASYVLLSSRPEYNDIFRLTISLAPVAYWIQKVEGALRFAVDNGRAIQETLRVNNIHELAPQSAFYSELTEALCRDDLVTQAACLQLVFTFAGADGTQWNSTLFPHLANYFPAGMSTKTLIHYYQNILTGKFAQFDYGEAGNYARYGTSIPPEYDASKVTAPVALFYGPNDVLSLRGNAMYLASKLKNVVTNEPVPWRFFNHLDFLWAIDAKFFLYDKLIALANKFKGK